MKVKAEFNAGLSDSNSQPFAYGKCPMIYDWNGSTQSADVVPLTIGGEKREKLSATWKISVWVG